MNNDHFKTKSVSPLLCILPNLQVCNVCIKGILYSLIYLVAVHIKRFINNIALKHARKVK